MATDCPGWGTRVAMNKESRREFLRRAGGLAAALFLGAGSSCRADEEQSPPTPAAQDSTLSSAAASTQGSSRVAVLRHSGIRDLAGKVKPEVVGQLLDRAVPWVVGADSAGAAWKSLLSPEDTVGLKVNCIAGAGFSTRVALASVIADRLTAVGILTNHIIIWDRTERELSNAGYKMNRGDDASRPLVYATDSPGVGYDNREQVQGSVRTRLSKILTDRTTAMINVPLLKDHGTSGMTLAMKNHYGSHHNPGEHHGNNCSPYLADLNALPDIRDKTRLIIGDVIRPGYNGGPGNAPQWQWDYNGVVVATDPVACDFVGWAIVEDKRKEVGMPTLAASGREPRWIAVAAQQGLGNASWDKIELLNEDVS